MQPVIMPKLGVYTEDVLLAVWHVDEGAEVEAGAVVLEMETDKTTADVEADAGGFLHRVVDAGQKVPIGTKVGFIVGTREEYDALLQEVGARAAAPAAAATPDGRRARRDGPLVSPRARALMARRGLPPETAREMTGSGQGGRITDKDVDAWVATRAAGGPCASAPAVLPAAAGELRVLRTIPLRGRRRTIANRMLSSLQTSAQLTSVLELDVKPLVDLKAALDARPRAAKTGVTAIVVKLVAEALRQHPGMNARVTDTEIELLADINVAVAVDTDDGLLAPVVPGADRLTVDEINGHIGALARASRDGTIGPDSLAGGTFTVSNGGIHPVDITTAVLNPPQVGIVWIGRIKDRPVVIEGGGIAVRPTMQACLTFDHRAVDGAPAAAFLGTFASLVAALPALPS